MIPVLFLPPGDQWDQHMLRMLFGHPINAKLALWPTGLDIRYIHDWPPSDQGLILVIPGRYWHNRADQINTAIAGRPWILAIRTGDEEDLFDPALIVHPNITWWIQTPRVGHDYGDVRVFGVGYPPHFANIGHGDIPDKRLDVFVSAQNTHDRRRDMFDMLAYVRDEIPSIKAVVNPTESFTAGMPTWVYAQNMRKTKVAPAPAGPQSPDSFRLYEALEAHAVPIADDITEAYESAGYWALVAPHAPFPVLTKYTDLNGYIVDVLKDWPRNANRIAFWWIRHKRDMAHWLHDDLQYLGVALPPPPPITVIVTASPIKSHPETTIISETVDSIRAQLPDAEIIIAHDGIREEQEHLRGSYEEYLRRVLWLADHHWHNVLVIINDEHLHQAVTVKWALSEVVTPLILLVEHDTPLCGEIPWSAITSAMFEGSANLVRFHHEASILQPHKHLMLAAAVLNGVPMTQTRQWSQRPHLASLAFYRQLLAHAFPNDEPNFIEDVVYGKLIEAVSDDGPMGWAQWRTWIYTPEGDMKRSYHTDGRAGESKFDG